MRRPTSAVPHTLHIKRASYPYASKVIHGGILLFSNVASDVHGQLHREPIHHDVVEEEVELERTCDERRQMRCRRRVRRHDYDKAERAREIGSAVYVGRDSAFLKVHVYRVNVSRGHESSNAMVLSQ